MKRVLLSLAVLSAAVILIVWIAAAMSRMATGPIYSVATLRAHLVRDAAAWVDRPLRIRAIATSCSTRLGSTHESPCVDRRPVLTDLSASAEPLPLAGGSVAPPVAFLRRVPLLSALVPAPQQVHWDSLAI